MRVFNKIVKGMSVSKDTHTPYKLFSIVTGLLTFQKTPLLADHG